MIDNESYYKLADYHYTPELKEFPEGIIHCDMGSIPEFFNKIRFEFRKKYVVISSRCDYGLHYQCEFPPYMDYPKAAAMFIGPASSHGGYDDVTLGARINRKRCNPSDKYSLKCYSFTEATFPSIPKNVLRWFVTNNTIKDDSRIVDLPFGINGTDGDKKAGDNIFSRAQDMDWSKERIYDFYVNFQFYTNERMKLFRLYSTMGFGKVEKDTSFDNYLDQLEFHNCNLCPPGNGVDCFRSLETLYMGCIPIMELNPGLMFYTKLNLPIIFTSSLEAVTKPVLRSIRQSPHNDRSTWDLSRIHLSYWKKQIDDSRNLLL
jgi:hypothetical protein